MRSRAVGVLLVISGGGLGFSEEFNFTSPLVADGVVYVAVEDGFVALEGSQSTGAGGAGLYGPAPAGAPFQFRQREGRRR